MTSVLDSIRGELENIDFAYAESLLLPVMPSDNVIGVLDDHARRLNTLALLGFKRNRELIKEQEVMLQGTPSPDERSRWIIASRTNRVRITLLTGLFVLAVNEQFPGAVLHEFMLVRQGWQLIWKHVLDPEDHAFLGISSDTTVH